MTEHQNAGRKSMKRHESVKDLMKPSQVNRKVDRSEGFKTASDNTKPSRSTYTMKPVFSSTDVVVRHDAQVHFQFIHDSIYIGKAK